MLCLPFHLATYIRVPYRNMPAPQGHPRKIVRKRRRRKLNSPKTLQKYESRIRRDLIHELPTLHNSYLSTFSVFSTETDCNFHHTNNAFVLMKIAREHGVHIKAVTSECKIGGQYRAPLLDGDTRANSKIVYVGGYNYFTKHAETPWSVLSEDKVYYDLE